MFSRILMLPFLIWAIAVLYFIWEGNPEIALWLVPPVVIAAGILVLSPQIDWWYYKRRPPELAAPIRKLFDAHNLYYQRLSEPNKKKFRQRVSLFMIGNDFKGMAMEEVPEDIKAVIASNAVLLTFNQKDFLMGKFETFVVYPHPFPSPVYQQLHASELHREDHVIIYSAEQLMASTFQPTRYFNIGMYELARAYFFIYPEKEVPILKDEEWQKLEAISGMPKKSVIEFIGLEIVDLNAIAAVFYFTFPEQFKAQWPDLFGQFERIF